VEDDGGGKEGGVRFVSSRILRKERKGKTKFGGRRKL